jgi:hypothetical protein
MIKWASGPMFIFALPDPCSTVLAALVPIYMFYAPGYIFDNTEGVGSSFHILCSMYRFRWYRERLVQLSCFMLPAPFRRS